MDVCSDGRGRRPIGDNCCACPSQQDEQHENWKNNINKGTSCGVAKNLGGTGCTPQKPCACGEGDCDRDADCQDGLRCFQTQQGESVPGVIRPSSYPKTHDICAWPVPVKLDNGKYQAFDMGGDGCTPKAPCDIGYGDCDKDADCKPGL